MDKKMKYELVDPREGDNGVKYSYENESDMRAKADELGATRYQGVKPDNERVQFVKVGEEWRDESQVKQAEEAKRVVSDFKARIERDHATPGPTIENMPADVKQAMADYGKTPEAEVEREAAQRIESRALAFSDAEIAAKHDKLAKAPRGDIAARLDVLREPEPDLIPPEAARKWAEADIADYNKLQANQVRQEDAAIEIMQNARRNALYAAALREAAPNVYQHAELAYAGNEELIERKEVRKAHDMASMIEEQNAKGGPKEPIPEVVLDAAALERLARTRGRDMSEAREAMGLNAVEPNIERGQQQLPPDQDAARSAWLRKSEATATANIAPKGNKVESDEIFTAQEADVRPAVPVDIERQYTRVGDKFYHPKHKDLVAFEDRGNRLETKSDNEQIAESMVRIAESRGWDEIKVSGSETFRREAWLEAAARGMHVKGYTPNEQDKVELAKRTKDTEANRVEPDKAQFRARENQAQAEGQKEANKAQQMAAAFAAKPTAEAVKEYPELAGAAAAVSAVEKQAGKDGLSPEARSIVMARVRQNVTNAIERGDIPQVKVTEEKTVEKAAEKEHAR